jgi:hypothetical protein
MKPKNYDALPLFKLLTGKFGAFKLIGVDEATKNYKLEISRSQFSIMYPVLNVFELEPYYKLTKTLVPTPKGNQVIIHIQGSRKHQG